MATSSKRADLALTRAAHSGPHRGLDLPGRARATCSAGTRCSRAVSAGPTSPAGTPRPAPVDRSRARAAARRDRRASRPRPRHDDRTRAAAESVLPEGVERSAGPRAASWSGLALPLKLRSMVGGGVQRLRAASAARDADPTTQAAALHLCAHAVQRLVDSAVDGRREQVAFGRAWRLREFPLRCPQTGTSFAHRLAAWILLRLSGALGLEMDCSASRMGTGRRYVQV